MWLFVSMGFFLVACTFSVWAGVFCVLVYVDTRYGMNGYGTMAWDSCLLFFHGRASFPSSAIGHGRLMYFAKIVSS